MIYHMVFWNLKENTEENRAAVFKTLMSMEGKIPEMKDIKVIFNNNAEGTSHDVALITTHESVDEVEIYQNDPYHLEVKKKMPLYVKDRACVDGEWAGV
jgi:hypothetical protein